MESMDIDSRTTMVVMRWVRFLLDRVDHEDIPELLRYYNRIGWIGEGLAEELTEIADGTKVQEGARSMSRPGAGVDATGSKKGLKGQVREGPGSETSWRMTSEDHLRSWIFISELGGSEVDKNLWAGLSQRLESFEQDLEEYYRV
jgi:archaellum component FlaD/FlaE